MGDDEIEVEIDFDNLIDEYINSDGDDRITKKELRAKYTGGNSEFDQLWKLVSTGKPSVLVVDMKQKIKDCQAMDTWVEAAQKSKNIWTSIGMNLVSLLHMIMSAVHLPWKENIGQAFQQLVVLMQVQGVTLMILYHAINAIIEEVETNKAVLADFGNMYNVAGNLDAS